MNNKKIHLVLFADSHLGYDYPLRPRINKRRRGIDFFSNFKKVLSYARKNNVDLVVHGGDLFFRSKVPGIIIDKVYNILTEFAVYNIPLFIVPGNHERSCLPPSLFLNHKNIYVFNRPRTYYLPVSSITLALSGFPFVRENIRDRFRMILNLCDYGKNSAEIKLLCMHQTIEGARVGPSNYTFRNGKDVIPLSILPDNATAILCGHIHREQILKKKFKVTSFYPVKSPKAPNGNRFFLPVIYPGSLERTSFAEIKETKGFYHLIFAEHSEGFWRLKHTHFIPLPTRPMINISINMEDSKQKVETELIKKTKNIDKNSIVRLSLNYPTFDSNPISLTTKRIRELLPPTITIQTKASFQNDV